jgi:hypothetical protein
MVLPYEMTSDSSVSYWKLLRKGTPIATNPNTSAPKAAPCGGQAVFIG